MNKLIETIKRMRDYDSENLLSLIENMEYNAALGKLPGVTPEMVRKAYNCLVCENSDVCPMPSDTFKIFLEAEEAIVAFLENDNIELNEWLTESDIFSKSEDEDSDNLEGMLLESLLEVSDEAI